MNEVECVVARFKADKDIIWSLSTSEMILLGLLYNEPEWIPKLFKHPVDAMDRLGHDWREMMVEYRRTHRR